MILYLVLVALAVVPIFTGKESLSEIFAIALTAPWSILFDYVRPNAASGNAATGLILVAIGAVINALLLYYMSRWVMRRISRSV